MSLDSELKEIEDLLLVDDPRSGYHELLNALKIKSKITPAGISLDCPNCITKRRSINIRLIDNKYGRLKWKCYGCEDNPAITCYDNLIGLIRYYHDQISPREAINLMIDVLYKPKGEAPNVVLTTGQFKGLQIAEIPTHYLKWLATKTNLATTDPPLYEAITSYLWGDIRTTPAQEKNKNKKKNVYGAIR